MIESVARISPPREEDPVSKMTKREPAAAPPSAARVWPAVLALFGSSGFIALFCLMTGEMYWDGYLSAFGLTPDEFPASASSVRAYAYVAAIEGLGTVVLACLKYGLWVVAGYATLAALFPLFDLPRVKAPWESAKDAFAETLRGPSRFGVGLRMALSAGVVVGAFAVVAYVGLCLVVASAGPHQAHQLGKDHGKRELDRLRLLTASESTACSRLKSGVLSGRCIAPVAYGEKSVAVIVGDRIHRVARDAFDMESPAGRRADRSADASASAPK